MDQQIQFVDKDIHVYTLKSYCLKNSSIRDDLSELEKYISLVMSLVYIFILTKSIITCYKTFKSNTHLSKIHYLIAFLIIITPIAKLIYLLDPINQILFKLNLIKIYDKTIKNSIHLLSPLSYSLFKGFDYFSKALISILQCLLWIKFSNFVEEAPWKQILKRIYYILLAIIVWLYTLMVTLQFTLNIEMNNDWLLLPIELIILGGFISSTWALRYLLSKDYFDKNSPKIKSIIMLWFCCWVCRNVLSISKIFLAETYARNRYDCCQGKSHIFSVLYWFIIMFQDIVPLQLLISLWKIIIDGRLDYLVGKINSIKKMSIVTEKCSGEVIDGLRMEKRPSLMMMKKYFGFVFCKDGEGNACEADGYTCNDVDFSIITGTDELLERIKDI